MSRLIAFLVALGLAVPSSASADVSNDNEYSNQTPYGDSASSQTVAPPAGYALQLLQTVGRHGARPLTKDAAEVRALKLWEQARKAKKLTSTGKKFKADLRTFQQAELSIGYGRLSGVGKAEWRGIGRRTADVYAPFFQQAEADGDQVLFRTTSVTRTQESAAALRSSLVARFPGLTKGATTTDDRMLIENGSSSKGRAAIARVLARSDTRSAARHLLRRLYSTGFVAAIKDPVAAALDLYLLYCTAPGLAQETAVTFASYVPAADRRTLAQAQDAKNFYRYGPGVAGERSSFRQADPVLADFFVQIDDSLAGDGAPVAAVFRLAHGETTMPFAARIKAPGSQQQASKTYSYASNPWRGWVAGRLAGNIEWALYTSTSGDPLVTMRYNENPVPFHAGCNPVEPDSLFYTVTELKRCLR